MFGIGLSRHGDLQTKHLNQYKGQVCNISANEISEIFIPALGTCPHVAAALQAHAVTVGADDHGPAGARAAELLEADVAAKGRHPRYRRGKAR